MSLFEENLGILSTKFAFFTYTFFVFHSVFLLFPHGSTIFGLNPLSLSSLLKFEHLYIRLHIKLGDDNVWLFNFSGKPAWDLNNTESSIHWHKECNLTNYCRAQ